MLSPSSPGLRPSSSPAPRAALPPRASPPGALAPAPLALSAPLSPAPVAAALLAVAALLAAPGARAQRDTPCRGCVLELPPAASARPASSAVPPASPATASSPSPASGSLPVAGAPVPLLVLLHGDEGNPSVVVLPRWSAAARERGVALLALRCPREEGCAQGSWWRWGGDPAWISRQIEAVAGRVPIDRERVWLAGWSGGASYLGLVAPELRGVTGLVLTGGGLPPRSDACPPCSPPVAFVAGNGNPLHHLAVASRDAFARCGGPVDWTLLPGKDHGGELESLDRRRTGRLLDWLESHRACGPSALAAAPASAAAASAPPPAPPDAPPALPSAAPPAPGVTPAALAAELRGPRSCGCQAPGASPTGASAPALLALALAGRRRCRLGGGARGAAGREG